MMVALVACGGNGDGARTDVTDADAIGEVVDGTDSDDATDIGDTSDTAEIGDTSDATDIVDTSDTTDIGDTSDATDIGDTIDTSEISDATEVSDTGDATVVEVEVIGPASCLELGHAIGERYAAGDDCNFCDCMADGTSVCSKHTCKSEVGGCTYLGRDFPYGARFNASDDCNECVCAASGLACTHRCPDLPQEGAILLESLDAPCGDNPAFTAAAVLDGMPYKAFQAPFEYRTDGPMYPETLPPTTIRVQIAYEEGGYIACRIPSPDQPALDIEATIEWVTADGQFDEGFHTYLRRNDFGFLDAWMFAIGAGPDELDGAFDPACLDPNGFAFGLLIYDDGHAEGDIGKACETDIMLTVGTFSYAP